MKLGEFINLRNKIEDIKKKCSIETLSKSGEVYNKKLEIDGKDIVYVITEYMQIDWKKYQEYDAINSLTNVLGDKTPFEYVMVESYFEMLESFEDDQEEENFDLQLQILKRYLGEEYEVPSEFYEYMNKKKDELLPVNINNYEQLGKFDHYNYRSEYVRCFDVHNNKVLKKIIDSENIKLIYNIIKSKRENQKENSSMRLARIMSDEELEEFQQNGIVVPFTYDEERIWDERNYAGKEAYYSFMAMDTRNDILLNLSSVIPKFKGSKEKLNLVFFESNDITKDMVYGGLYKGHVLVDDRDCCDIYGIDTSAEVAVPYYSNENFKILKSYKTNGKNIEEDFIKGMIELKLFDYKDIENKQSAIYRDFMDWIDECHLEVNSDNFREEFSFYRSDRMHKMLENKYFYEILGIEDISEDLKWCMRECKNRYNIDNNTIILAEGNALQKLINWALEEPMFDYDEYDEYDRPITEEEIEITVKQEPLLDREGAKQCLMEELCIPKEVEERREEGESLE